MKIRMLQTFTWADGKAAVQLVEGSEHDIPDGVASRWIRSGAAVPAKEEQKTKSKSTSIGR